MKSKTKKKNILKLGLPKGSLQEATFEKLAKAGYDVKVSSRSYLPYIDDEEMEIRLIRAQEVSRYVEHGYLDCGITGHDWVIENGSKVHEVGELLFSKATRQAARWVLAVPENSRIRKPADLQGKRIATEVVQITKKYLRKHKVKADVEFSWGATEVKAHELVDAIVEITETGKSLIANKLRIVDTLLTSTPRLIVNQASWKQKWGSNSIFWKRNCQNCCKACQLCVIQQFLVWHCQAGWQWKLSLMSRLFVRSFLNSKLQEQRESLSIPSTKSFIKS